MDEEEDEGRFLEDIGCYENCCQSRHASNFHTEGNY